MPTEPRPPRIPLWVVCAAGLLGAASVALAEPSAADFGEVLEGWAGGSAGMPWLRVRASLLVLASALPIGTIALRMGLVVALIHAALAASVARRTIVAHADGPQEALLGGCAVLAGALAASFPAAFEAVRAPSAAALGVVVLLFALQARPVACAFGAGLLLALDPVLFGIGAIPLWLRLRGQPWRTWVLPLCAGAIPLALLFVPGRALYTFPLMRPTAWPSPRAAWTALAQVGWAAAALAAVGVVLSIRRGGVARGLAIDRLVLLALAALAAVACGPSLGRGALILVSALVAESVASSVWLGGALLVSRRIPLARATVGFALLLLLAWPLARLDAAIGHPVDARVANAAVELPLLSSVPERSILLFRDDAAERHAACAQVTSTLSSTVDVLPIRHVETARVREAIAVDPSLAPVVRETLLTGAPSEFVLSNLAAQRPTFVEFAPSMPKPIAKHLLPAGALFRFDPEPRGASDRAGALDAQKRARDFAAARAPGSADHGLRLIRASRRLAVALAATGEKESAARGVDQLRAVAGDDALVSLLVRKSVLQGTPTDLGDIVFEE